MSALGTGTVAFTGNSTLNVNAAGTLALAAFGAALAAWAARCRGRAC